MARDAQAIALYSCAQSYEPLPEFPALAYATASLEIATDALMLALCPAIALQTHSHLTLKRCDCWRSQVNYEFTAIADQPP
jgi:hypothetical protein